MTIDTREKRQSVAWVVPLCPPSVTPNASKDQEWRQEVGWGYAGILVPAITDHTIILDGEGLTSDASGVHLDAKRRVRAVLTPGDAAVNYVFEETEVS